MSGQPPYNLFDQPPPVTGKELAEEGVTRALLSAERAQENWSERAFEMLKEYIRLTARFQTEDFRAYCREKNFEQPPNLRAYGGVILRAKHAGLIVADGFDAVENKKAHACFSVVWKVVGH